MLAAAILSEIGDISRFSSGVKLVAYAGIDPTVRQSGEFTGSRNKMSKRGWPYLRRALWLAANAAKKYNPIFHEFYQQKLSEGKHPLTAAGESVKNSHTSFTLSYVTISHIGRCLAGRIDLNIPIVSWLVQACFVIAITSFQFLKLG